MSARLSQGLATPSSTSAYNLTSVLSSKSKPLVLVPITTTVLSTSQLDHLSATTRESLPRMTGVAFEGNYVGRGFDGDYFLAKTKKVKCKLGPAVRSVRDHAIKMNYRRDFVSVCGEVLLEISMVNEGNR
jgi:hypothetical protein